MPNAPGPAAATAAAQAARSFDSASLHASFVDLIGRVRAGDQSAAADLVRLYQPEVLRFVRFRLSGNRLRRVMDSLDLCQGVLLKTFDNLARGRFELRHPAQLARLLRTIADNEFRDQLRRQRAARRPDRFRDPGGEEALAGQADSEQSPSQAAAAAELWELVRARLSSEDQRLMDLRLAEGRDWAEIATECGENAEALRKRLTRAIDRAASDLGLADD